MEAQIHNTINRDVLNLFFSDSAKIASIPPDVQEQPKT